VHEGADSRFSIAVPDGDSVVCANRIEIAGKLRLKSAFIHPYSRKHSRVLESIEQA
jgi:hypothetical protein